jgi:hypothetical protein
MVQWGKKPAPNLTPRKAHVSAGLLMGYVRLLVEQQSQLVSLDGLMRNGLASDGSSLGILFAYYEFICLISYGYDTAAIRFCFFYMPTIS